MTNQPTQKEETTMTQVDQYREYVDAIRPPDPPRASVKDIELLSQTIAIRIWAMRSEHTLAEVLSDGFFEGLRDVRLRREDRIEVVASWGQPVAEHATLVVNEVDKHGLATVSLLQLYKRAG
jgi:hypothetical protein